MTFVLCPVVRSVTLTAPGAVITPVRIRQTSPPETPGVDVVLEPFEVVVPGIDDAGRKAAGKVSATVQGALVGAEPVAVAQPKP